MKSSNERPLTQDEAYAAKLAMAARQENDKAWAVLKTNITLKERCIEAAIKCNSADPCELARKFHAFLMEDG